MVKKSSTWAARLKSMFVGAMIGLSIPSLVLAQTATLLPDAQQRYFNDAGQPVASGSVTYYIPGTTTKKTVWTNSTETSPTTNPVLLDAGGKPQPTGQTYGDGCYQQVVKDTNGIQIWSAVTCSTGSGGGSSTVASVGDGLAVGTVIIWNGLTLPPNYVYASGQALSRGTYSQLLATVTLVQSSAVCVATSTTLSGLTDTTQLPIGAAIEGTCISPNTTVVSKSTNSVVMSNPATASLTTPVTFFPFGDGDGASTFNVPNYNGIYLVGRCNMNNTACTSISSSFFGSVDPNALNAEGGAQFTTLFAANLPPITSTNASQSVTVAPTSGLATTNVPVTSGTIAGNDYNNGMGSLGANFPSSTSGGVGDWTKATGFTGLNSISVTSTGTTSSAFSRLPPSATVNYAIKALQDNPAKIGLNVVAASRLATTAALPANTYNNGSSGVGATLTATSNGALSIDGVAIVASDQVLVKNEATQANNGIYIVSQTGSASLPYILVRATFFDQASEMVAGTYTVVTAGTVNTGTSWVLQNSITTVGTDAIVFNEFTTAPPNGVPGGAHTQLQYNNAGVFDGVTGFTFSGGTLTVPAFTLSGTINGGGNQLNDVIIGNTTPLAGSFTNLGATGTSVFGTNATLPGGGATIAAVNGNAWTAIPAMAGFGPQLVVVGPDGNRGAMALQSYMQSTAGNESSYLAFTSRGTMATPASIVSGDSVGEFFAHGSTITGGFQFLHNAGAGFTMVATDNFLVGAAGELINVYTTPTGTGTATLNSTFNASGGLTITSGEPALFLNKNAAGSPPGIPSAFGSNAVFRLIEVDTISPIFAMQSFSTGFNPPVFLNLAARGTGASTTATQSGDILSQYLSYGYATSSSAGYVVTAGGGIQITATNNYSTTTAGARVDIVATPVGSATAATSASIGAGLMVGNTTDEGAGTVNATGAYYANGTKGVTCSGALTVISSITIKNGIITAAAGTGGTCS